MALNLFFDSLPENELTSWETDLRKVLLQVVGQHPGFPFIEWIDRRIGGEVEVKLGENDTLELFKRDGAGDVYEANGANDESKEEKFLNSLPSDSFAPQEEALRDAIFEFLARWKNLDLAVLRDLERNPTVQNAAKKFLPKNVQLKAWIEHRIGREIEIRGSKRGAEIVLTPSAHEAVCAKAQQIGQQEMMQASHIPMMPRNYPVPAFPGPPMHQPIPHPGMMHGRAPPAPYNVDPDNFFENLPADMLLPAELALREALMNLIQRWSKNKPPSMREASSDPEVRRCKVDLLPPKVPLADWIERRIGGEIELRQTRDGHDILLRGEASAVGAGCASGRDAHSAKEDWFNALPADSFTQKEQNLREALVNFLSEWKGAKPPTNADLAEDREVLKCRRELLPPGCKVAHRAWIERRIGGEIETRSDGPNGQWMLGWRGSLDSDGPHEKRRRTRRRM